MQRSSQLSARVMVLLSSQRAACFSTGAKSTYNVPEGHHGSDLTSSACHIGLGRRRDLTMRQDLALWKQDAKLSLADVFKVRWGHMPAAAVVRMCSHMAWLHLRHTCTAFASVTATACCSYTTHSRDVPSQAEPLLC